MQNDKSGNNFLANISITIIKINKNLKFKKGVGITIKSKEASGNLATYLAMKLLTD